MRKSLRQLAMELEISPAYLSMILSGQRKCPEKLQAIIESVHKVVYNQDWALLHTQEVTGSSPVPPTT